MEPPTLYREKSPSKGRYSISSSSGKSPVWRDFKPVKGLEQKDSPGCAKFRQPQDFRLAEQRGPTLCRCRSLGKSVGMETRKLVWTRALTIRKAGSKQNLEDVQGQFGLHTQVRNMGIPWWRTSTSSGASSTVICAHPHLKNTCVWSCQRLRFFLYCGPATALELWKAQPWSLSYSNKVPSTLTNTNDTAPFTHTATKKGTQR